MGFDSPVDRDRRRLLYWLGGAVSLMGSPVSAAPRHVSESDPLAQALGYKEDASQVDRARFPAFKPGEKCAKCRFFQGTSGQRYGPCQIFSGMLVNADGWCTSYNAKV